MAQKSQKVMIEAKGLSKFYGPFVAIQDISFSIPASHLQPMTEVAKPVIERAAAIAHCFVSPVIMTRAPHILNASA